ncbi:MAG: amidase [Sulfurospirillaceae bacterium]|nr:amidase [Sulfurospirillaceae bacterium]
MDQICEYSLDELIKGIANRDFSCTDVMRAYLKNISEHNEKINAIAYIDTKQCLDEAKKADERLSKDQYDGILHGIPIGVKDNYKTTDYPTTACSNVFKEPKKDEEDATVIKRLKQNGAIVMAKTNMHEWAYGATNEISKIGSTKNPWNQEYITGGSSGGSGAGLAASMFPCALGSDTGGSVRIPAAGCGVSGLKPTYGLLSKDGVYPLSFSLDVVGPMAKSAKDLEILFKTMLEDDKLDEIEQYESLTSLEGLKFGVPVGINFERNPDVDKVFKEAINKFKSLGAIIEEVEVPLMEQGLGAWKAILYAEATAYHQNNLKLHKEGFSDGTRIMLESGEGVTAVEYLKAWQFRDLFIKKVNEHFKRYDALLFTTLPVTPPKIGAGVVKLIDKMISSQDSMTYLAWFANYMGSPQVSIPCGFGDNNLPVGLAVMSKAMDDFKLLQISKCYQKETDFHKMYPKFIK